MELGAVGAEVKPVASTPAACAVWLMASTICWIISAFFAGVIVPDRTLLRKSSTLRIGASNLRPGILPQRHYNLADFKPFVNFIDCKADKEPIALNV